MNEKNQRHLRRPAVFDRPEGPDELKASIEDAATTGQPRWVQVNQGEGSPRTAELFISGSPAIALIMEPSEDEEAN
jgi:hypothetical protein